MNRNFMYSVLLWLTFCPLSYAIDTYFPGDGAPGPVDVETQPPQYYPPQHAQPDPDEERYNNPATPIDPYQPEPREPESVQPINPNVTSPTNEGAWGR